MITTLLQIVSTAPDIVESQEAIVQILIWLGSAGILGLSTVVIVLWKSKIKDTEYIREQDKANLEMLNGVFKFLEHIGADTSKIHDIVSENKNNHSRLEELRREFVKYLSSRDG